MGNIIKAIRYMNDPKTLIRKIMNTVLSNNVRKFILGFPSEQEILTDIQLTLDEYVDETIFIFPLPTCPWGYMFQRPQQLARSLAKNGYPVFYLTDTSFTNSPDWDVRGLLEVEKGVFLLNNCGLFPPLEAFKNREVVIWQYWPHQLKFVEKLKLNLNKYTVIYDAIDNLSTFDKYPEIEFDYRKSLVDADIVLATSRIIYNDIKSLRDEVILVPNGVETKDFYKSFNKIPELTTIKSKYTAIIGYYGAVAEWFDFDLMKYLAEKYPNWGFLIIGEVYGQVKNLAADLREKDNVYFINRVSYENIPDILSYFDVGIIPFVINEITLSTSPVKAYEYLAGGKEVVSTTLPEVELISKDFVAHNQVEFGQKIEDALSKRRTSGRVEYLKRLADKNSWNKRITTVTKALSFVREQRK